MFVVSEQQRLAAMVQGPPGVVLRDRLLAFVMGTQAPLLVRRVLGMMGGVESSVDDAVGGLMYVCCVVSAELSQRSI